MALSIIVNKVTGQQLRLRVGENSLAVNDPATEELVTLSGLEAEPLASEYRWDTATRTYLPQPSSQAGPIARTTLTKLEFIRKFTMTENATLTGVRLDSGTPLQTRAQLETLKEYRDNASNIKLTDPDTILGVNVAVGVLVAAGVVADGPARIAEILSPLDYNEQS